MKKDTDPVTAPSAPAAAPTPAPVFNPAIAIAVPPRRHEPSARTVGYVQPAEDAALRDLFSATGSYILTVTAEHAATYLPAAPESPVKQD